MMNHKKRHTPSELIAYNHDCMSKVNQSELLLKILLPNIVRADEVVILLQILLPNIVRADEVVSVSARLSYHASIVTFQNIVKAIILINILIYLVRTCGLIDWREACSRKLSMLWKKLIKCHVINGI
jgi:hypothetical protein